MTKLLIIGLDGATMDLIEPWAEEGKLPVFSKIMKTGGYGRLPSVLPVLSSAAWSSFMTGMNPGKHGLYDFVKRAPDSYRLRPVNRSHNRGTSLWKLLSEQGKRVVVINVPMTYPPEPVNGILITGLGTPAYKNFTHPAELSQVLLDRGYKPNLEAVYKPGSEIEFIQEVTRYTDHLTDTTLWLMKDQAWDLFMVVYREPDEMAHFFWHFMDPTHPQHIPGSDARVKKAILEYYQQVDQAIGRLMEEAGPDTNLMILSDHGTGAFYKDVLLNEWLRQQGWLSLHDNGDGGGFRGLAARIGLTRNNISTILRRSGLGRVEIWIKDLLGNRIEILPTSSRQNFPDVVDWPHTKAYSFGYNGQICINLKGREPQGTVSPGEEYDQICREITQRLYELVDPDDGKPVVDQVIHRREAFHGPALEEAPDLVVIMRELSYTTRSGFEFGDRSGTLFTPPRQIQTGSHRMEGIIFLEGPDIRAAGYMGNESGLPDLTPTALHLLDCPVPDTMDGKVLIDWLIDKRPVKTIEGEVVSLTSPESSLTPQEEEDLIKQLKALGYLE